MNKYKLYTSGIYAVEGIKRFNNNTESYEKCLFDFLNDTNFPELNSAFEKDDVTAAFNAAHALKGLAGNLSFNDLYRDIEPLVEELRAGNIDGGKALFSPVCNDYQKIITALNDAKK